MTQSMSFILYEFRSNRVQMQIETDEIPLHAFTLCIQMLSQHAIRYDRSFLI